jgi:hypothetical protein
LNGSNRDWRGGIFFRGSGHADFRACATVRRPTPYLSAKARCDRPSIRESRLIAANNSTLVIRTR